MNKKDFVLKVEDFSKSNEDWKREFVEDTGLTISVSAWDGSYMVDDHIVELFPELEKLGLADLAEGQLEYDGDLDIHELGSAITELGFNVEII